MKLYAQLSEEQQHQAFHFALDGIIFQVIEENEFKYVIDEEFEEKEELEAKIADLNAQLAKLTTVDDKYDLIVSDEFDMIFDEMADLAQSIAGSSWFKECGESVIPLCALEEHGHDEEEGANEKDKVSNLN